LRKERGAILLKVYERGAIFVKISIFKGKGVMYSYTLYAAFVKKTKN